MQLPIDTIIQPGFTQHPVQRALYSLWQARCRAGRIPFWQSLPCHVLEPYLPATSVIGPSASNRSVIRIACAQMNHLLGSDSRGHRLDRLCTPPIKAQFERLISQVFARQCPMSLTLRSQRFGPDAVLTVLPLLDRQGQCCRALAAVDLIGDTGHSRSPLTNAPFSDLGPVYYAQRPSPSRPDNEALVLCLGDKRGAQPSARPYLKLVS